MKKFAIGIAVLVALIVGGLLAVPLFFPIENYKDEIAARAGAATGRDLTIAGPLKLSLLPRVAIEAGEVSLANAPGSARQEMVTLERLLVRFDPWTYLFSREIAVDSFVLIEPVVHLEVDKKGEVNWNLGAGSASDAQSEKTSDGSTGGREGDGQGRVDLSDLSLGDVRIERGHLTYDNAATGDSFEVSNINMKLALAALDRPLVAEGGATWHDQAVNLSLAADNLRRLLDGEAMSLRLSLRGKPLSLAYEGSLTAGPSLAAAGRIELDVPSLRALAAWAGSPIENGGSGLGPLAIGGRAVIDGSTYTFEDAAIKLDDMTAKGRLSVDLGGAKPYLRGALAVDLLDLNPYLPAPEPESKAKAKKAPDGGASQPGKWSDEPIDLSALKTVDADFDLKVGGIRVREIKVGESSLEVSLKGGLLMADLTELKLYDGSGSGRTLVDGRGAVPALEQRLALKGVTLEPLLRDAAGFDRLEGTGGFDLSIKTSGRSQRAMVGALNGSGAVKFVDGAIKGINLAAMVRNIESAFLASAEEQKTDFAELSGTFQITNGLVRNEDLQLLNPLLRVTGKGSTDLPARTVDYRIKPKAVASLTGQGGDAAAKGLAVPIIAEGPWHDITYRPDLSGMAKDPGQVLGKTGEGVKGAVEGLKSKLGGDGAEESEKPSLKDAGKTLKKLFGD